MKNGNSKHAPGGAGGYLAGYVDGLNWTRALAKMLGDVAKKERPADPEKQAALRGASAIADEIVRQIDDQVAAIGSG